MVGLLQTKNKRGIRISSLSTFSSARRYSKDISRRIHLSKMILRIYYRENDLEIIRRKGVVEKIRES